MDASPRLMVELALMATLVIPAAGVGYQFLAIRLLLLHDRAVPLLESLISPTSDLRA